MNSSKWIWRIVSTVSVVATILLIIGFVYAVRDVNMPQAGTDTVFEKPSQPEAVVKDDLTDKQEIMVTAIGDSLAKGTGDNTGSGFVRRSIEGLSTATGKKVTLLNNLGINGLTTARLLPKLEEKGAQYALKQSDIILVSIGGNDLFKGSQLLSDNNGESKGTSTNEVQPDITPDQLLAALPEASRYLKSILEKVRQINPDAYIIYVGLYNPFGDIEELKIVGNDAVATWNHSAQTLINKYEKMTLVPTSDLFTHHLDQYLSSDHFHPNGEGYQQIADRIVQGIR
ncbi:GDSL-type esterase/lipase family protein [Paenibacillus sp. IHBB 10380]|uniref:GDSL-type esterase/lipase family protein n=1 Tax=Paenibacillus sp. IHBB 10380 TaxID=1566358 RepID=UPI000B1DA319|nr:GDSL-type esterase/lipase family protein [Paenibacillus sp. IHBB 10380]